MKIPIQEKVAELERRIQALEEAQQKQGYVKMNYSGTISQEQHDKIFGSNWKKMWSYFDKVMKEAFGD